MSFADHFSTQAERYSRYRPTYPPELFTWLATLPRKRERAWDAATGSGQAARGLAEHFDGVVATDASRRQVAHARPHDRVRYAVATAEASGLADASVDLVTVAQAYHWFAADGFLAESRRVARPGAVLAVWTYSLARVAPEIDAVVDTFYEETVGPYWPPERRHVETGYRALPFPEDTIEAPPFASSATLTLPDVLGYLSTWSAAERFRAALGRDPLLDVGPSLARAWGPPDTPRPVVWPLLVRAAHLP